MEVILKRNIDKLVLYIKNLKNFRFYDQKEFKDEFFYNNHMGAIIIDGVLQAGIKWETIVRPRLKKLLEYREAKTTTGFFNLYNQKCLRKLINFNSERKINTIKDIVELFIGEKVETPSNLKRWLGQEKNIKKLKKIHGIGNKTIDYFKILAGIPNNAVDRHLINFLKKAKIKIKNYNEAHKIINKTADVLKINKSLFDYSIWKYMSSCNKKYGKNLKSRKIN